MSKPYHLIITQNCTEEHNASRCLMSVYFVFLFLCFCRFHYVSSFLLCTFMKQMVVLILSFLCDVLCGINEHRLRFLLFSTIHTYDDIIFGDIVSQN